MSYRSTRLMTFTLATENIRKCYQAPFLIFRTGPGNEATIKPEQAVSGKLTSRESNLDPVPSSIRARNAQGINITNCDVTTLNFVNPPFPPTFMSLFYYCVNPLRSVSMYFGLWCREIISGGQLRLPTCSDPWILCVKSCDPQ